MQREIVYTMRDGSKTITNVCRKMKVWDMNMVITLMGDFISRGREESKVYFGIVCYRKDGTEIQSFHNLRKEEPYCIKEVSNDNGLTVFKLSGTPISWFGNESLGYYRALGIYLDGDVTHEPDYVHYFHDRDADINSGSYQLHGDSVTLNKQLPDHILALVNQNISTVVIMNHHAGGTYHYGAAANKAIPKDKWETLSTKYQGEAFNDLPGKLRKGTDSIEILILAHYGQGEEKAVLEMRNPSLTATFTSEIIA